MDARIRGQDDALSRDGEPPHPTFNNKGGLEHRSRRVWAAAQQHHAAAHSIKAA
jgi:hypothetical protein